MPLYHSASNCGISRQRAEAKYRLNRKHCLSSLTRPVNSGIASHLEERAVVANSIRTPRTTTHVPGFAYTKRFELEPGHHNSAMVERGEEGDPSADLEKNLQEGKSYRRARAKAAGERSVRNDKHTLILFRSFAFFLLFFLSCLWSYTCSEVAESIMCELTADALCIVRECSNSLNVCGVERERLLDMCSATTNQRLLDCHEIDRAIFLAIPKQKYCIGS